MYGAPLHARHFTIPTLPSSSSNKEHHRRYENNNNDLRLTSHRSGHSLHEVFLFQYAQETKLGTVSIACGGPLLRREPAAIMARYSLEALRCTNSLGATLFLDSIATQGPEVVAAASGSHATEGVNGAPRDEYNNNAKEEGGDSVLREEAAKEQFLSTPTALQCLKSLIVHRTASFGALPISPLFVSVEYPHRPLSPEGRLDPVRTQLLLDWTMGAPFSLLSPLQHIVLQGGSLADCPPSLLNATDRARRCVRDLYLGTARMLSESCAVEGECKQSCRLLLGLQETGSLAAANPNVSPRAPVLWSAVVTLSGLLSAPAAFFTTMAHWERLLLVNYMMDALIPKAHQIAAPSPFANDTEANLAFLEQLSGSGSGHTTLADLEEKLAQTEQAMSVLELPFKLSLSPVQRVVQIVFLTLGSAAGIMVCFEEAKPLASAHIPFPKICSQSFVSYLKRVVVPEHAKDVQEASQQRFGRRAGVIAPPVLSLSALMRGASHSGGSVQRYLEALRACGHHPTGLAASEIQTLEQLSSSDEDSDDDNQKDGNGTCGCFGGSSKAAKKEKHEAHRVLAIERRIQSTMSLPSVQRLLLRNCARMARCEVLFAVEVAASGIPWGLYRAASHRSLHALTADPMSLSLAVSWWQLPWLYLGPSASTPQHAVELAHLLAQNAHVRLEDEIDLGGAAPTLAPAEVQRTASTVCGESLLLLTEERRHGEGSESFHFSSTIALDNNNHGGHDDSSCSSSLPCDLVMQSFQERGFASLWSIEESASSHRSKSSLSSSTSAEPQAKQKKKKQNNADNLHAATPSEQFAFWMHHMSLASLGSIAQMTPFTPA